MTNPASQQPAPIPEVLDRHAQLWDEFLPEDCPFSFDGFLVNKIVALEAALQVAREWLVASGYDGKTRVIQSVDSALSTPLGTPGRDKP